VAPLTRELSQAQREVFGHAKSYGLDPFDTIFELLSIDEMNEVIAYGGFDQRYPHWRFGMEYEEMQKRHKYGLGRVYELVINNDPCLAYLQKSNSLVDQKMVMAHVYGHSDFFKHNLWFSQTNRKMVHVMADHAAKMKRYMEKYGEDKVETFVDTCLSLDNLIDAHGIYVPRQPLPSEDDEQKPAEPGRLVSGKGYLDKFINPPDVLQKEREKLEEAARKQGKRFPEQPEKDVLLFLRDYAPLERWQSHILEMLREEAYYFAPQGMTKVMNEGWAAFWHSKIMTEKVLGASEMVDYADHHSRVTYQGRSLNPYKLGLELFRDIEWRWNTGRFGKEWEQCDDPAARECWDKKLGLGMQKIFEVRKTANDVTFIDQYLTREFCERNNLFVKRHDPEHGVEIITSREFSNIKQALLFQFTNLGNPIIRVVDGNFGNRNELLLNHQHGGVMLDGKYIFDTLTNLYKLWQRPVHIDTITVKKDETLRDIRVSCTGTGKDDYDVKDI
jgi:stage V sporulation protein R